MKKKSRRNHLRLLKPEDTTVNVYVRLDLMPDDSGGIILYLLGDEPKNIDTWFLDFFGLRHKETGKYIIAIAELPCRWYHYFVPSLMSRSIKKHIRKMEELAMEFADETGLTVNVKVLD